MLNDSNGSKSPVDGLLRFFATLLFGFGPAIMIVLSIAALVAAIFSDARPEVVVLLILLSAGAVVLTVPDIKRIWDK